MTKRKFYSELTKHGYTRKEIGQLVRIKGFVYPYQAVGEYDGYYKYITAQKRETTLRILTLMMQKRRGI